MNNVISTFFVLLNPLTPMPAVTTVLHCSTSDATTIDKKIAWRHLYSNSARGKDLSTNTQARETGSIETEICTEMLRILKYWE